MPKINHEILRWARSTAGLSLTEAAKKLGLGKLSKATPADRLASLEAGEEEPTRSLLSKMAKHYRRPLITFYMENPPRKGGRGQDFRKLPDDYSDESAALIDALIRDVLLRQSLMRSALEDDEGVEQLAFVGSKQISDGVLSVAQSIKETISLNVKTFRAQSDPEEAFKYLRDKVEQVGVFVLLIGDLGSYHTAFKPGHFRGFALSDKIAPFIIINDRDARAAWSFTLLHELTHIWLGQTGISSNEFNIQTEIFCNRVAGDILMPAEDLEALPLADPLNFETTKNQIGDFALKNNVSSTMVAYKLFSYQRIDERMWDRLRHEFTLLWMEADQAKRKTNKDAKGGPTYYTIRRHRLGKNFISQVNQLVRGGELTTVKASKILGIAPRNLQNLVETSRVKK